MKKINYFLVLALLIVSCQGDEGEIGPAGPQGEQGAQGSQGIQGTPGQNGKDAYEKLGFVEGTVTGIRRDGTPFSEPFKFEYPETYFYKGFQFNNTLGKFLYSFSYRFDPNSYQNLTMFLEVVNKDQSCETLRLITNSYNSYQLSFQFQKELNANTLFTLIAQANVEPLNYTYPVNPTLNNSIYKFAKDDYGDFQPDFFL